MVLLNFNQNLSKVTNLKSLHINFRTYPHCCTCKSIHTQGDYEKAIYFYTKCIAAKHQTTACLSNRSLCYLKLARYQLVIDDCTIVIREKSDHVKCLFRRAQVYTIYTS